MHTFKSDVHVLRLIFSHSTRTGTEEGGGVETRPMTVGGTVNLRWMCDIR